MHVRLGFGYLRHQPARGGDKVAVAGLVVVGEARHSTEGHYLGAVGLNNLAALDTDEIVDVDAKAVAFGRRDRGDADAGVAAGGFGDGVARLDEAVALRLFNHRQRNAIFDAVIRVK